MDADTRERIDRLRSLALFRHLPEAKLEELTRVLAVQAAPGGDLVFEDASAGETMFLVAEGQVRIEKRVEAGGFAELALLSPGDVFGEMALIDNVPRSARAVAHTDATLFVLGRQDLRQWLASDPLMAVGFFVELLRVLSHRLRRTSQGLILLYDLSHLTVQRFEDEARFLGAVLHRMIPHLDGEWSGAAYLYNEFNDEVSRVGTEGRRGESLPQTLPIEEAASRWLDAASFCVALSGKAGTPLGFLVARNELAMSAVEKAEVEVALTTAAHLVASALQNIKHDTEERLRARLQRERTYGSSL
jgi:CRP/FNR family cyclic AMP-dependent transcriptional regulator